MAQTPAQQLVLQSFQRALNNTKASAKIGQALVEAGIVESHLQNLNYGDKDSLGSLQERTSIYGRKQALSPYASAIRFIRQAQAVEHKYATPGELAQAVQRSAFPGRYDQVAGQASSLLGGRGGGNLSSGSPYAASSPSSGGTAAPTMDIRRQIALSMLGFGGAGSDPLSLALQQAQQPVAQPSSPTQQQPVAGPRSHGTAMFDGKPVEPWIAPILAEARKTGLWKGTLTSGQRTRAGQLAAAKNFGLQNYGPKGPLGSNHIAGRGAADVTDPEGLKRALQALHINRLKSAMANDPEHFSRTGF